MIQQGYGRLLAALVVAGGVHALLLLNIHVPVEIGSVSSSVQIDLVAAEKQLPTEAVEERGEAVAAKESSPAGSESPMPVSSEADVAATDAGDSAVAEQSPQVAYHPAPVDENSAAGVKAESSATEVVLVPVAVQAVILAQVSYPRLARRRGWEGQVHLSFDVSGRVVSGITLLKASEYQVLNEAAQEGLLRMRTVALADGRYWLPVEFRLR